MRKKLFAGLAIGLFAFAVAETAGASIIVRGTDSSGGQLIYDDQQDITWYDFNAGYMDYPTSLSWVAELSITLNDQVFSDWRLPHLDPTFSYYNNSPLLSEMGPLFYFDLELTSGADYTAEELNDNVFENLQPAPYWTDMHYMSGWYYTFALVNYTGYMESGMTGQIGTRRGIYGALTMAVMDGDVIPEPATVCLLGSGLAGFVSLRRKKLA